MELTKEFFNIILDFGEDWNLEDVEIDSKDKIIYLDIKYISDRYEDPDSLEECRLYDHTEIRKWRHLDVLGYISYVRCRVPRIKNNEGKVKQISKGWAGKYDRHTYKFEVKVIDLLVCTKNQTKTAAYLNCSFRLINRILHRCTERGMGRRNYKELSFKNISIDEKSFKSGHNYVTVISHPKSGTVLDVGLNRDGASVEELFDIAFTNKQLEGINTVSMDMWKAYINTVKKRMVNPEIVHDKYHLIAYLNKAMDQVRRREVKDNEALKNSRYSLLKNEENMPQKQKAKYEEIKASNFEVCKVWHIRENFKVLFDCNNGKNEAAELLKNWAQDSFMNKIKEVNKVILMMLSHFIGVTNALITNFTNAMAERLNGKIQEIKFVAKGYRTFKNFRSAILFFHGGLNLYPLNS